MKEERYPLGYEDLYNLMYGLLSHDKVMARCVLGNDIGALKSAERFDSIREQKINVIKWMGNLMTLAGAFLYSKFNKWRSDNTLTDTIPNALYLNRLLAGVEDVKGPLQQKPSAAFRVFRVLDGLYDSFDMNFFVIKNILINSQLEAGFNTKNGKRSGLSKILGFPDEESFLVICDPEDSFAKQGKNLSKAFSFINLLRTDPLAESVYDSEYKFQSNELTCAFEDVFQTMEFMKRVRLDIDEQGIINFYETKSGSEQFIQSHGVVRLFIKEDDNKPNIYKHDKDSQLGGNTNFYLLERISYQADEKELKAAITFVYRSFDESDSISVYFAEKSKEDDFLPDDCDLKIDCEKSATDVFKNISGYLPGTRSASSFFRGMISTHYRYHNTLAPSIVDAIDDDEEAKIRILIKYIKNDPTPFKEAFDTIFKTLEFLLKIKVKDPNHPQKKVEISALDNWGSKIKALCDYIHDNEYRRIIDWDTLIARILVYEGPTEILHTILLPEDNAFNRKNIERICKKIIAGLEMRYIDDIFEAEEVAKLQKDYYSKLHDKIDKYNDLFPGDYANKMECKALAQTYIDAIVRTLTNLTEDKKKLIDDAGSKFAENSINDMLLVLNASVNDNEVNSFNSERAFKQTIMAFISFYAGIKESCRTRVSYEFDKSAKILDQAEIKLKQTEIENDFFKGMKEKAIELSKIFNGEKAVETMIKKLWEFVNNDDDKKYYHAMLARAPVDDVKLKKIFKVEKDTVYFIGSSGDMYTFARLYKDGKLSYYLRKIVGFLYGEDVFNDEDRRKTVPDKNNYAVYKEYAKKVVYPQIVTFAKHREDGDANDCLIMDHNGAFAEWHDGEVKILTEFKYDINHAYYALPNLNRIETEWWVDPILISCYQFDKELREALKEE